MLQTGGNAARFSLKVFSTFDFTNVLLQAGEMLPVSRKINLFTSSVYRNCALGGNAAFFVSDCLS